MTLLIWLILQTTTPTLSIDDERGKWQFYENTSPTNITLVDRATTVVTLHYSTKLRPFWIEVNPKYTLDEASIKFLEALVKMQPNFCREHQ